MVRVRFAPSPTGYLHVGGARTALFNFLFARQHGGVFILRIDDTDSERSNVEFESDIFEQLRWLGLSWDEGDGVGGESGPYRQSERRAFHLEAIDKLIKTDRAYRDDGGAVRLRYLESETKINDIVCGECSFSIRSLGPEPVLLRSDGNPTYHLASVADDIAMGITHVIRGQDHLTNTAKHVLLFEALGAKLPQFAHLPLILGTDGSKLSKRSSGDLTMVREFRQAGYLPEALVNFLMLLGWSHPEAKDFLSLQQGISDFKLERVRTTAAIFETRKLLWLNGQWIRSLSLGQLADVGRDYLGAYRSEIEARGDRYWYEVVDKLRDSWALMTDIGAQAEMLVADKLELTAAAQAELALPDMAQHFFAVASAWQQLLNGVSIEGDVLSVEEFSQLVSKLKKEVAAPTKQLFKALRVAVTGDVVGPELKVIVPLIRFAIVKKRAELAVKLAQTKLGDVTS